MLAQLEALHVAMVLDIEVGEEESSLLCSSSFFLWLLLATAPENMLQVRLHGRVLGNMLSQVFQKVPWLSWSLCALQLARCPSSN